MFLFLFFWCIDGRNPMSSLTLNVSVDLGCHLCCRCLSAFLHGVYLFYLFQDTTFDFEKRRNRPVKYDREAMGKTLLAMKKVSTSSSMYDTKRYIRCPYLATYERHIKGTYVVLSVRLRKGHAPSLSYDFKRQIHRRYLYASIWSCETHSKGAGGLGPQQFTHTNVSLRNEFLLTVEFREVGELAKFPRGSRFFIANLVQVKWGSAYEVHCWSQPRRAKKLYYQGLLFSQVLFRPVPSRPVLSRSVPCKIKV